MAEYLTKYGYAPDQEAMGRALEMIASNLESVASEQVYKECFSMMDLTTLKTNDTPASVRKLVDKVNCFRQTYPENRPSYIKAAKPDVAIPLYEKFLTMVEEQVGKPVGRGIFGADMKVSLVNDGPVTIIVDSKLKF